MLYISGVRLIGRIISTSRIVVKITVLVHFQNKNLYIYILVIREILSTLYTNTFLMYE